MAPTVYSPFKVALTPGQMESLRQAITNRSAVTFRLKPEQIGQGDTLLLTTSQIGRLRKAADSGVGADLEISKTQIPKVAPQGGSLFSTLFSLARPLVKPAVKALASAGLTFGAEKALKKIFGNGFGPQEVQLYNMVKSMSPPQKEAIKRHLASQGQQRGGFLGMLASIGVPLAIDLVRKIIGKGMHTAPPRGKGMRNAPPPRGRGMRNAPPGWWEQPPPYLPEKKWY